MASIFPQGTSTAAPYAGGVSPVGFIEPLNQVQRTSLGALYDRMTPGGYQAAAMGFMNPYQSQVVNATATQLGDLADQRRAQIGTRYGSSGWGSSAQAIENAEVERGFNVDLGSLLSRLNYQGYGDAGNTARQTALDSLAAGNQIQQQNQAALNITGQEINALRELPFTRTNQLGTYLSAFSPTGYTYTQQPSTMQQLGGAGMFLGFGPLASAATQGNSLGGQLAAQSGGMFNFSGW